jgi:hypothetical protein
MRFSPIRFLKNRLGVAIDWRVRDALEVERDATVEMGKTFVRGAAHLTDQHQLLEARVAELEKRLSELEEGR